MGSEMCIRDSCGHGEVILQHDAAQAGLSGQLSCFEIVKGAGPGIRAGMGMKVDDAGQIDGWRLRRGDGAGQDQHESAADLYSYE